jgi:choice-of-anchor B domain-containing protein
MRLLFGIITLAIVLITGCDSADSNSDENLFEEPSPSETNLCADTYPCRNITLLANLTPTELLGDRLNDIWGWTDPQTGKEYALVGLTDRLTFVDISTPAAPQVIGTLPESIIDSATTMPTSSNQHDDEDEGKAAPWRDIKVFDDHAYVVSDGQPHGLQIFDLTRLRNVSNPPETFTEDVHFTEFGNAHNIAINEASGFAYVVGSNRAGGGLYILDISSPKNPVLAGTHADTTVGRASTGYVHDTQCVMYNGPDNDYAGQEVCFNSSETHFVIADVTDKMATSTIAKSTYAGNAYAHQGWLTQDHRYFLLDDELDDELDENNSGGSTTTYIWDVQDLDDPQLIGRHEAETISIDHNLYVRDNYVYQANYTTGLRILDVSDIGSGSLREVAFFDTFPASNAVQFDGAWSNYPFFDSGIVIVSDISNGLFILSPELE